MNLDEIMKRIIEILDENDLGGSVVLVSETEAHHDALAPAWAFEADDGKARRFVDELRSGQADSLSTVTREIERHRGKSLSKPSN